MCFPRPNRWLFLSAALALAGCGNGAPGNAGGSLGSGIISNEGEFRGSPQSTGAYRERLTPDEAYHLLRRAAFGATPDQVNQAASQGLTRTVDDLLTAKPVPGPISALAESFEDDIPRRWLVHFIDGPNPLQERLALFWHDRFATARRVLGDRDRGLPVLHWEMLRRNALGDYRLFLEELTIDPLMLIWLDGANSPKQNPNENYTREFWELFTLGRDVLYTEADIREGARAFTGITLLRERDQDPRPIYDLLNHDETPKSIFPGRAPAANYDYRAVIDLTLDQPEAARYVARNLFQYFVHENPTDALVNELADGFVDSGFEIAPLVRRILRCEAMFSPEARGGQITSPVEHIVGVARTLDMHIHSEESQTAVLDRLARDLRLAGHEMLNPPGVQGWGENAAWLEDQWVISRIAALGRRMEYGPDRTSDLPYHLLPPVETWEQRDSRAAIVDALAAAFHITLTEEERTIYIEVLDQNGWLAFHLEQTDRRPQHVMELIRLMAMDDRVLGR